MNRGAALFSSFRQKKGFSKVTETVSPLMAIQMIYKMISRVG